MAQPAQPGGDVRITWAHGGEVPASYDDLLALPGAVMGLPRSTRVTEA